MKAKWHTEQLGKIAPASSEPMPREDRETWNLSLEDIESSTGKIINRKYCMPSELLSAKCAFNESHVLYSKLRPYLNKVVLPDSPGVGTSELIPLKPDPGKIDREFLAYYLRSPIFLEFSKSNTRGANLPRIAMDELWKHQIAFPSIQEQRRIVKMIKGIFTNIDEIQSLRTESLKEAEAVFPSILSHIFDSISNSFPFESIDSITSETRYGTSRQCTTGGSGIPVLRIPNVADGTVNTNDLKYCDLTLREIKTLILQNGDILIVRTNGSPDLVGRCAVFEIDDSDFAFASYLIRIRVDSKKVRSQYLVYFLESTRGRDAIAKIRKTSAGQFNINSANIRAIRLPLPSLSKQDEFIEQMNEQKAIVSQIKHTLEEASQIDNLSRSILNKAFTGQL